MGFVCNPQFTKDTPLRPRKFLIAYALWLIGIFAEALAPLLFVHLIIAFAPHRLAFALKGQNVRDHTIQKPPIMGDHYRTPAEIDQRFFQRPQCIDIEIVGRFIQ